LKGQLCLDGLCREWLTHASAKNDFESIPLPPPREPNPEDFNSDVDCDGIPDWEEMEKVYANGKKTDPKNRDTDGDGIWDGVELGRDFSPDPLCADYFPSTLLQSLTAPKNITDPTRKDSDCDGLSDGDEDKNKNGRFEPELGETNPNNVDTDGDGLWDGVELGITLATAADPNNCPNTRYDADPSTTTDPLNPDTDGDGIWDGVEDANQNGRVDEGETDPNNPNDIDEETRNACSAEHWVPVDIQRNFLAQIALGLPMGFANSYVDIQRGNTHGLMGVDSARNVAFLAWQHTGTPVADMDALRELANRQASALGGTATLGSFNSWDAPSTTDNALGVTFTLSGHRSPAARVNAIAEALLGEGSGSLPRGNTTGETQYIRAQYVLRGNGEVIGVLSVALDNDSVNGTSAFFGLNDVAGGAALARYFDRTVVQCERSVVIRGNVDFLFVVDDSSSMASSQNRLAEAGAAMAQALNNSNLDWRAALVTSSYHLTTAWPNKGIIRGFTNDAQQFQSWLRQGSNCIRNGTTSTACTATDAAAKNCSCSHGTNHPEWEGTAPACGGTSSYGNNGGCWVGIGGRTVEGMLGAARLALIHMSSPTAEPRIQLREDSDIIVIILSDVEDQTSALQNSTAGHNSWEEIEHFIDFFQGVDTVARTTSSTHESGSKPTPVPAIRPMQVNAIYCPAGANCGDSVVPSAPPTRIQNVVQATGGVLSSIQNQATIATTMTEVVNRVIGNKGVFTQKPLIGASLRVAIQTPGKPTSAGGACDGANVTRSRKHGFDYDGIAQTVTFFGDCRPANQSRVAISYRAWEASDEIHSPCENDIYFEPNETDHCKGPRMCNDEGNACVCPSDCGGCPQGMRCNADVRECGCFHPLN